MGIITSTLKCVTYKHTSHNAGLMVNKFELFLFIFPLFPNLNAH